MAKRKPPKKAPKRTTLREVRKMLGKIRKMNKPELYTADLGPWEDPPETLEVRRPDDN